MLAVAVAHARPPYHRGTSIEISNDHELAASLTVRGAIVLATALGVAGDQRVRVVSPPAGPGPA